MKSMYLLLDYKGNLVPLPIRSRSPQYFRHQFRLAVSLMPLVFHMAGFVLALFFGIKIMTEGRIRWRYRVMRGWKASGIGILIILVGLSCMCYIGVCLSLIY